MGTAEVQGKLWGAAAEDWANLQEPAWEPTYRTALSHAGLATGVQLLDVGCGAGGVLMIARELGATVSGLDASENLVAIARTRLPDAPIEIGEMEELPFPDAHFDVVTSFNAFQFAASLTGALAEARRVCRPGGTVFMFCWGSPEDCQLMSVTMPAVLGLLPPPPPGSRPPGPIVEAETIDIAMREAGLVPADQGEFSADLAFDDAATAVRAVMSAGVTIRASQVAGEAVVREAIRATLPRVTRPDGSVVWTNRFRWVRSSRPR